MSDEDLREVLLALWPRNRARLVLRLTRLSSCVVGAVPLSGEIQDDLEALIGALGSYGWPIGSRLVATVQHDLVRRVDATCHLPALRRLIAELSAAPAPEPRAAHPPAAS